MREIIWYLSISTWLISLSLCSSRNPEEQHITRTHPSAQSWPPHSWDFFSDFSSTLFLRAWTSVPASGYYLTWFSDPQKGLERDPGQNTRIAYAERGLRNLSFTDPGLCSGNHKYREISWASKATTKSNWRGQNGGVQISIFSVCLILCFERDLSLLHCLSFLSF